MWRISVVACPCATGVIDAAEGVTPRVSRLSLFFVVVRRVAMVRMVIQPVAERVAERVIGLGVVVVSVLTGIPVVVRGLRIGHESRPVAWGKWAGRSGAPPRDRCNIHAIAAIAS
jgi:hypothetical protein